MREEGGAEDGIIGRKTAVGRRGKTRGKTIYAEEEEGVAL